MFKKKGKFFFLLAIWLISLHFSRLIYLSLKPKLPQPGNPVIFYSNQCRQDLKVTILKAIKNAKKTIYLVMFGLSDETIIQALKKKEKENVSLKIYFDKRSSPEIFFTKDQAICKKKGGLLHQKILIVDESMVFLGSTNLTKTSLSMHDNLVIGLHSGKIANFLTNATPFTSAIFKDNIGSQPIEIWLLPDNKNMALQRLKTIIKSANQKIKIAMFTFTHPALIDELIHAKKRKIDVTVVIDGHSAQGASAKAVERLKKEKIKVLVSQGPELLHHKYLYVDNKTLVCGSANWTKAAFSKNHDLILILENLTKNQIAFMEKLQQIIEYQTL